MNIERMTGLPTDQLLDLTVAVAPLLDPDVVAGLASLDLFESVVAVVTYQRSNATEDFIGAIFDVSQATLSRRLELLERPITAALAGLVPDPVEATRGDTILVDGTLVGTSDWSDQDDLFSGKHHRTGLNVQVAGTVDGRLLALGDPIHGSRHDMHAWDASGLKDRLKGFDGLADLGYIGADGLRTGTRRKPGCQLTDRELTENISLARIRAAIERVIAHVKNWKVLKTGYRRPLDRFPVTLRCIEALYHLEHSHRRHAVT